MDAHCRISKVRLKSTGRELSIRNNNLPVGVKDFTSSLLDEISKGPVVTAGFFIVRNDCIVTNSFRDSSADNQYRVPTYAQQKYGLDALRDAIERS
jgi:hypothetical protein